MEKIAKMINHKEGLGRAQYFLAVLILCCTLLLGALYEFGCTRQEFITDAEITDISLFPAEIMENGEFIGSYIEIQTNKGILHIPTQYYIHNDLRVGDNIAYTAGKNPIIVTDYTTRLDTEKTAFNYLLIVLAVSIILFCLFQLIKQNLNKRIEVFTGTIQTI